MDIALVQNKPFLINETNILGRKWELDKLRFFFITGKTVHLIF